MQIKSSSSSSCGAGSVASVSIRARLIDGDSSSSSPCFLFSAEAVSVAAGAGAAGPSFRKQGQKPKNGGCWMAGTAVWGPVLGVSCYQWARMSQSSAIVLAVAATSTLLIIPLARIVEKDKPGPRQLLGTVLAAGGVIALCLVR